MVQNIDLVPAILNLAGITIPDNMQGRSLVSLLRGGDPADRREAVCYHYYEGPPRVHNVVKHYEIRTDCYTLAHFYEADKWELFDLLEDPEQLLSVYRDSEYANVQQGLKQKLKELQRKYMVEFLPKED